MKVLIADDEPVERHALQSLLKKWGHEVVVAMDGKQAWAVLTGENPPHLAILDWVMPAMDGLRICRELRLLPGRSYTYILVLTARDQKDDVIEVLEAGADDYLAKPFHAQELRARLHAGERVLDLQEQLLQANRALQIQATHDALTGILNRGAILETLMHELARSRRDGKPVGVILADIDNFKTINDTYGHSTGDVVICQTARAIRSVIRAYDSLGRYGGEEFLTVLPGCDLARCQHKAEQIRNTVSASIVSCSDALKITVTLSLGVASACAVEDCHELLEAADQALYQAKRDGRNRVRPSILNGTLVK